MIAITATALLRYPAAPVFLHPRHWPIGCWECGRLEIWHTQENRCAPMKETLEAREHLRNGGVR